MGNLISLKLIVIINFRISIRVSKDGKRRENRRKMKERQLIFSIIGR